MGQMTVGILYGCKPPKGLVLRDDFAETPEDAGLLYRCDMAFNDQIAARQAEIDAACMATPGTMPYEFEGASAVFVPDWETDAEEELIGFWVAAGASGKNGLPTLGLIPVNAKRLCAREPYATAYRNAVERWDRFAAWAATQGVKLPRAKLWVTQTEVA